MLFRLYIILMLPGLLFSQAEEKTIAKEEKTIAKVGGYRIYEPEFKERFDFSANPGLHKKNNRDEARQEFLKQLIAEKLLSLEARQKGYDTLEVFKDIMTPLENMYARDALYTREVKSKAAYSDQEITEGILRIKKQLKLKFIYSKEQEEINYIFSKLENGASFDSLLQMRSEAENQTEPRTVTFGTMDKEIEDSIYKLIPGHYTRPLQSRDGFYILMLVSEENNTSNKDSENIIEDVKRIVETRAAYKQYLKFYRSFFGNNKVTAEKHIFEKLIRIFLREFKEKYSPEQPPADKYYLIGDEIKDALNQLDPELKPKDFIKIKPEPVKIKNFLNQLSHEGLYVKDLSESSIRIALSSYIRKFIEDELLAREADSRGLRDTPDVLKYVKMWEDSYLSKMLMADIFDSLKVSDEEALNIYKRSGGKPMAVEKVKIAEILTDNLPAVELVLNELANGRNIKDLAKQYTLRDSLRNKGGEFDYFPVSMHGEIGKAASLLNIGEVYGPVKLEEGYSIFQLLDRKEEKADKPQDFNEVREQIKLKISLSRFKEHMDKYTASLALKYGVEIDEAALDKINNVFLNLVVIRYMGFGGEIYAVPYTEQFTGWYKLWKERNEINL